MNLVRRAVQDEECDRHDQCALPRRARPGHGADHGDRTGRKCAAMRHFVRELENIHFLDFRPGLRGEPIDRGGPAHDAEPGDRREDRPALTGRRGTGGRR